MERGWHILDFIVFITQKRLNLLRKMQLLLFFVKDGGVCQGCDRPETSRLTALHFLTIDNFNSSAIITNNNYCGALRFVQF